MIKNNIRSYIGELDDQFKMSSGPISFINVIRWRRLRRKLIKSYRMLNRVNNWTPITELINDLISDFL